MNPDTLWGSRIRGIGVVHYQGQTLRPFRKPSPLKRRRNVIALARVSPRNSLPVLEGRRRKRQGHETSLLGSESIFTGRFQAGQFEHGKPGAVKSQHGKHDHSRRCFHAQ